MHRTLTNRETNQYVHFGLCSDERKKKKEKRTRKIVYGREPSSIGPREIFVHFLFASFDVYWAL